MSPADALPRPSSSTSPDALARLGDPPLPTAMSIPIARERSLDRESAGSDVSEASAGSLKRAAADDDDDDEEPRYGRAGGRKKMRDSATNGVGGDHHHHHHQHQQRPLLARMDNTEHEAPPAASARRSGWKRKEKERARARTDSAAASDSECVISADTDMADDEERPPAVDGQALAEDLAQELQCGCCAELVYKPVVVMPCEHFFCGSCCHLWIQNGGTNCPACRGPSTTVNPSRHIQAMVDVLLRAAPHKQRTMRERQQADEIYPALKTFRIPPPRTPSPAPSIPPSTEFVRPCPHCSGQNPHGWSCPHPVAEGTWRIDDGAPPGHGFCANCETLLALTAPSTTRCDFCLSAFCGIQVPGRCHAVSLSSQHPHGFSDVGDLIQSAEIYEAFEGNTAEVEMMLEYMEGQSLSPRAVYKQIIAYYQSRPTKFAPLIEMDLFTDIHGVPAPPYYPPRSSSRASASSSSSSVNVESTTAANVHSPPAPDATRTRICRLCAAEILLYGIKDWWIRERRDAVKKGKMQERKDCEQGRNCQDIRDPAHGREFNHIIVPFEEEPYRNPSPAASSSSSASSSSTTPVNNSATTSSSSASSTRPTSRRSPPTTSTSLPGLAELGIPLPVLPFSVGTIGVGAGTGDGAGSSLPHFLFSRSGGGGNGGSTDGSLQELHAFLSERFVRTGLQQQQEQSSREGTVPTPGSSQQQNGFESAHGYVSDGSSIHQHRHHQIPIEIQQQQRPETERAVGGQQQPSQSIAVPCAPPAPLPSDARLADAMERHRERERERERELEARYVASFAQALLNTEEAEADLRRIRSAQALAAHRDSRATAAGSGGATGPVAAVDSMESTRNINMGPGILSMDMGAAAEAAWGALGPLVYGQMPLQPTDGVIGTGMSASVARAGLPSGVTDGRSAPSASQPPQPQPQSYPSQF